MIDQITPRATHHQPASIVRNRIDESRSFFTSFALAALVAARACCHSRMRRSAGAALGSRTSRYSTKRGRVAGYAGTSARCATAPAGLEATAGCLRQTCLRLSAEDFGAGEGNRTLVFSLEGCCSTIELHPRWAMPNTAAGPASTPVPHFPAAKRRLATTLPISWPRPVSAPEALKPLGGGLGLERQLGLGLGLRLSHALASVGGEPPSTRGT